MRKLLLVISVCLLCSITSFTQPKSYLKENNIKGNVLTIEEKTYKGEVVGSEIIKDSCISTTIMKFSFIGNILEKENIDCKGIPIYKGIYSYDSNGVLVRSSEYDYKTGVKNNFIVEYEKNFNTINYYNSYVNNSKILRSTFSIDNKGNKSEGIHRDDKGTVTFKETYKYDNLEHVIEKIFEIIDLVAINSKYTNDNNGNLIVSFETTKFSSSNYTKTTYKTYTYKYDKTGNWIYKIEKSEGDKIEAEVTERIINYKPNVKK